MSTNAASQPRRRKIVITGATGFVGSHALMALWHELDDHTQLIAACRDKGRLPQGYGGACAQGDLRDPQYRQTLPQGAETALPDRWEGGGGGGARGGRK